MPFYERQPYITPLYQLLLEVMRGDIRVPRFQRPGSEIVWTPDKRGDLLDSLFRGFPVGTILLWSTTTAIPCLDKVAGFGVVDTTSRSPMRLLLDGHQRISTLLAVLGPGLTSELPSSGERTDVLGEQWVFETEPNEEDADTRDRFLALKARDAPSPTQVPLGIVLDRVAMNRWIRDHQDLTDEQVRAAESVRDKLREYNIPVAVLAAESLSEATESFKRVNSSGTPMSRFHMVKALAYKEEFDLEDRFDELKQEHLEPIGWGDVENTDILRVCAGLTDDIPPTKLKEEKLSAHLRDDEGLSKNAVQACAHAAKALNAVGIHGPRALPYAWQLITLAILLGRRDSGELTLEERDGLRSWFWVTTYGEVFAGAPGKYDRAKLSLDVMLEGADWLQTPMDRDVTRNVEEVKRFDFRAVRSKALSLLLARVYDGGEDGHAHRSLAALGTDALSTLRSRSPRSDWYELIITTEPGELQRARDTVKNAGQLELGEPLALQRYGFPSSAPLDDLDAAIEARRQYLIEYEKTFVESFGLVWR